MNGAYDQIPARLAYFLTTTNTVWLYPMSDIQTALNATAIPYTFDGTILAVNNIADLITLYNEIYAVTTVTQPVGNVGYTLGVGSQTMDLGKEIIWQINGGLQVIKWRLMQQLTPQLPATVIPVPGNSPDGTIGYGTVWVSYKNYPSLDEALFVRVG
jgi:hypothetical protein